MFLIKDLYDKSKDKLFLELVAGKKGVTRKIKKAELHRPGLDLVYMKNFSSSHILVFGKTEIRYLKDLEKKNRIKKITQY